MSKMEDKLRLNRIKMITHLEGVVRLGPWKLYSLLNDFCFWSPGRLGDQMKCTARLSKMADFSGFEFMEMKDEQPESKNEVKASHSPPGGGGQQYHSLTPPLQLFRVGPHQRGVLSF